jgi:hypothetical protein
MSKFKDYIKELQGMERITLILDLLVDKKITKEEAVVLIANDKQIKDAPTKDAYPKFTDNWIQPYSSGTNPYTSSGNIGTITTTYDSSIITNA